MSSDKTALYLDDFLILDPAVCSTALDFQDLYGLDGTCGFTELFDDRLLQSVIINDCADDLVIHPKEIKKQGDGDVYKPRKIRGTGRLREGYCRMCNLWFKLKTSSYWYHMNYKHGINSKGVRYPEPQIKYVGDKAEGFCAICNDWVVLGHKSNGKSTKFGWFRHCQKKHGPSKTI
ncbi:hypothetical protein EHEL_030250 [Encephalitozoon hellem ATCC 50504]|uniref:DUF4451 domain-containing protein n=1 Tax=Encephalitozoon hellem TaxID=27973 RepID=A0A9Q9F8X6_ENCHE|nr:uncharacterized protein EHEL_030250 [Encephalitozoon hellem ATCC 50504]AFM97923.1 hypothetical protein EHEL_030250 [Encephalitozoon hellem ATCC 50504]UTX42726.1 DUF4451 domain-containing protein [Encephalitozoon hellem]|eukprot:XP_003886904.1 hypothetical protein EHEL_030250 [Encephalitozoon hellem ATCC 50504]